MICLVAAGPAGKQPDEKSDFGGVRKGGRAMRAVKVDRVEESVEDYEGAGGAVIGRLGSMEVGRRGQ